MSRSEALAGASGLGTDMLTEQPQEPKAGDGSKGRSAASLLAALPTPARSCRGGRDAGHADIPAIPGCRPRGGNGSNALDEVMRRQGVDEAWNALEDMQRNGVLSDKYTICRMLTKTVDAGRGKLNPARIYRGIGLVERFVELQPRDVDEVLFNALLDTCCRLKDLKRLEATVVKMRELRVTPSPVTLGVLVKTYGQAGDLKKVLQVWDEMETQRGQANAVTFGCMIDACVKCGNLGKAVEIFEGMRETGKHRNTILYTTLIKGFGAEKDLQNALKFFREMPLEGVQYNTITYNSILDACIKCGDISAAEGLLQEMTAAGQLEPDLITFSTLLKGYCHMGDIDKALQVVQAIKSRGLRMDELVYNTLMDGCVKAGDYSAGIGLFEEMVHTGMRPSAITHSILARLYQRAGYDSDAPEAVANLYHQLGVERPNPAARGGGGVGGSMAGRGPARRGGQPSTEGFQPATSSMMQPSGMQVGGYAECAWGMQTAQGAGAECRNQGLMHAMGGTAMIGAGYMQGGPSQCLVGDGVVRIDRSGAGYMQGGPSQCFPGYSPMAPYGGTVCLPAHSGTAQAWQPCGYAGELPPNAGMLPQAVMPQPGDCSSGQAIMIPCAMTGATWECMGQQHPQPVMWSQPDAASNGVYGATMPAQAFFVPMAGDVAQHMMLPQQ